VPGNLYLALTNHLDQEEEDSYGRYLRHHWPMLRAGGFFFAWGRIHPHMWVHEYACIDSAARGWTFVKNIDIHVFTIEQSVA